MPVWVIKTSNVQGDRLTIESRRRVSIKEGDSVISLTGSGSDAKFKWHSVVERRVQPAQFIPEEMNKFVYQLGARAKLEEELSLDDMAYTLTKIKRTRAPSLHFRLPYTSLPKPDFEAIKAGQIFWSRTALGYFLGRLPDAVFNRFLLTIAATAPRLLVDGTYAEVWIAFQNIVINELVSARTLLEATRTSLAIVAEAVGREIFADLGLLDDGESNADYLMPQLELLREMAEDLEVKGDSVGIIKELNSRISKSESEDGFTDEFRGRSWLAIRSS